MVWFSIIGLMKTACLIELKKNLAKIKYSEIERDVIDVTLQDLSSYLNQESNEFAAKQQVIGIECVLWR